MISFLFSCEHATCAVPEAQRELFRGSEEIVQSPKGWDPGALNLAQGFAMKFRTPLVHGDVTRLLIDLDENGDDRWSEISKKLPEATRAKLVERTENIYRAGLNQRIAQDLQRHRAVLHLMIHTADSHAGKIQLLTAPHSDLAEEFTASWLGRIRASGLDVRHERAAPLSGLSQTLRGIHPANKYAPIRIEVSQSYFLSGVPCKWETMKKTLIDTMRQTGDEPGFSSSPKPPSAG